MRTKFVTFLHLGYCNCNRLPFVHSSIHPVRCVMVMNDKRQSKAKSLSSTFHNHVLKIVSSIPWIQAPENIKHTCTENCSHMLKVCFRHSSLGFWHSYRNEWFWVRACKATANHCLWLFLISFQSIDFFIFRCMVRFDLVFFFLMLCVFLLLLSSSFFSTNRCPCIFWYCFM